VKKINAKLPKPKITFDRVGQIWFTLKEVIKLVFKENPKLLTLVFVLNGIWGLSSVPTFYLEKLIIDKLIAGVGISNWQPILYSILILVAVSLLLSLFRNFLSSYIGFLRRNLSRFFDAEIDALIGKKMTELDLSTIENPGFKDRFNKVERESGRRAWQLMMPLSDIPNYLVGFISATLVLVLVSPLVSIGVILFSLPRFFINSRFIKKEYKLHSDLSPLHRIWGWISYYLRRNRNYMEMKILDLPEYLTKKMKDTVKVILQKQMEISKKREISSFIGFLPLNLYEMIISTFLVFWVIIGKITVGSFQLYLRSLRSAEQNLSSLVSSFLEIYENYIYVTDLVWLLELEVEGKHTVRNEIIEDKNISIEFNNVWFKYTTGQKWILKDISFSIKPGEKIAIVGENGVGKSTLIKLLAGFYLPTKGDIFICGKNLKNVNLRQWRNQLAVLFQDFELYPFTVREAIGYGDIPRMDDIDSIQEVAKKTGIHKFVEELSLKYDNPLSPDFEHGVHPSTGQWQRIGISRILFRISAKVLILDEPTSNVDPEAEEKIFAELKNIAKDKVMIFVTQRFSTVKIADRIFVVDKGEIRETGTHSQLMSLSGRYARLFTLQAEAYINSV
jgi:ABC-type multidrug transport system fused ATPase/permease subunit